MDGLYYTCGADAVLAMVDMPSREAFVSLSVALAASGMFSSVEATPLMTVAEMDAGLVDVAAYRGAGG
jgi:uncharacterized protein with GYD domain